VILAAGLGKIMEHIRALIPHMKPGALLTDVGSVKAAVCEVACEVIEGLDPPRIRFVGGHPLAGSEQRGIDAARADLFDGATCILTPPVETDPDGTALTALRLMWESVGCRVKEFSPEVHDRLLAEVSHLPHVVAAALIGAASDQALPLAATGFADTTRVASGNAALWVDVCLANRKELLAALATMQVQLSEFTTVLRSGDATALEALFQAAKQQRDTRFTAKEQA
jgi:prephenate dehydrogenase